MLLLSAQLLPRYSGILAGVDTSFQRALPTRKLAMTPDEGADDLKEHVFLLVLNQMATAWNDHELGVGNSAGNFF